MRHLKKSLVILAALAFVVGGTGCVAGVNTGQLVAGGMELGKAVTVSETELVTMSINMRQQGDATSNVAPASSKYTKRLNKLVKKHQSESGKTLNYKVYLTNEVNANATADGSIRVYAGLMDLMTDDELLYVLGHEIGHIVDGDSLDSIRMSYASSGLLKAAGATSSIASTLTSSQLGDLLLATVNAQYSQKQELDADAYALRFMQVNNYNPKAAVTALRKLEKLGGGGGLFASHPAPGDRAAKLEAALATGNLPEPKKL